MCRMMTNGVLHMVSYICLAIFSNLHSCKPVATLWQVICMQCLMYKLESLLSFQVGLLLVPLNPEEILLQLEGAEALQ